MGRGLSTWANSVVILCNDHNSHVSPILSHDQHTTTADQLTMRSHTAKESNTLQQQPEPEGTPGFCPEAAQMSTQDSPGDILLCRSSKTHELLHVDGLGAPRKGKWKPTGFSMPMPRRIFSNVCHQQAYL